MPSATGAQSFVVPRDVAAGLRVLTAHLDVSLLDLAVAEAYQLVLARHSGQDDIVVAIPSPGRHHPVLLRSGVRDSIPFRDFLIKVRATAAAASIHADVPFQQVVEQLGLDRALARFAVASVDRPALSAWPADLTAGLIERDDELCVVVDYRAEKFDAVTAQGVAGQLARVLKIIRRRSRRAAGPDRHPDGAQERVRLLIEWNDTDHDVIPATFPELFEAQVARTPDAPALLFDATFLSYAGLDARANRLAHLLIAGGAGPEQIVALALPRSADIIVAQLAVLKAGAAFLPLDPAYPAERIALMLADARPVSVLTRRDVAQVLPGVGSAWWYGRRAGCAVGTVQDVGSRTDRRGSVLPAGSRAPRLRHLHLGLDRATEGRDGHPRRVGQLLRRRGGSVRRRTGRPGTGVLVAQFRRLCAGAVHVPPGGGRARRAAPGSAAGRAAGRGARRRACDARVDPAGCAGHGAVRCGGQRVAALPDADCRWRGLLRGAGRPLGAGPSDDQFLWAYRVDGGVDLD